MKNVMNIAIASILISLVVGACVPLAPATSTPTATPATTQREAQVQSVVIQILDSDPPQVNAVVRGNLTESCATLGQSQAQYGSNTFRIGVYAVSPTDRGCARVSAPFETTIALDTSGLGTGTYTVIANGVSAVFSMQPGSPAPTTAPTEAPTEVPTAVPTSHGCTDSAAFVSDVTIPDHTLMAPGVSFTKTWRLKNSGSCTWNSRYLVAYMSGTTMTQSSGYWIVQPGQTVAPGQSVNISIGMSAPVQDGNYASYWGLKKENGQFMPIQGGDNGNSFYVKIRVPDTRPQGGNIVAASIDIDLEQGSGTVCTPDATYLVHAYITADGPTTASYEIGSTAGQISAGYILGADNTEPQGYGSGTVEFEPAMFGQGGTKTITLPFRFVGPYPYPDDITMLLRINDGEWHSAKVMCP